MRAICAPIRGRDHRRGFPAACRASPRRRSPLSARAAATKKSGPWITTAPISTSLPRCTRSRSRRAGRPTPAASPLPATRRPARFSARRSACTRCSPKSCSPGRDYRGTNSAPAWSPDGSKIMFMSSMYGNPGTVYRRCRRRPRQAPHLRGRRQHLGGLESEDRPASGVRQRPRRHSAALHHGRRRWRRAKGSAARHGICDRPGVVAERPTAGVQLAPSQRQLRPLRDGYRLARNWSNSRATPAATSGPVGRPTAGILSLSPRARARGRSGPCSPTAPMCAS